MKQSGTGLPPGRDLRRFAVGDLVVDAAALQVTRDGQRLPVTGLSFDLLLALVQAAPATVTTDELLERVWTGVVVNPETVAQRIKMLRDALGDDPRNPRYVSVVRGRGYRLVPPARLLIDAVPRSREAADDATPSALSNAPPDASSGVLSGAPPDAACSVPTSAPPEVGRAFDAGATADAVGTPGPGPLAAPVPAAGRGRTGWMFGIGLVLAGVVAALAWRAWQPATVQREPPAAAANAGSVDVVGLPVRTVAVLPFENLSTDPGNAFIGRGIAEMVLNRLASSPQLFVLARGSSFAFEGRDVDVREIGRQLGARYLVQGSVQRSGDRLRLTAQLVDANSGRQLRSLAFDRALADLFAVQDEIASGVAQALDGADGVAALGAARTTTVEAQLEYLTGLDAVNRHRVADSRRALDHFQRAQQFDPGFAAAYIGEARAREQIAYLQGAELPSDDPDLRRLAARVLELDPSSPGAYVLRARLADDPAAAERDLRHALTLAPNDAGVHFELGELLAHDPARRAEAMERMDRAIALDPLQPRIRYVRAMARFSDAPDLERFRTDMLDVLRLDPGYTQALTRLSVVTWAQYGRYAEAIDYGERAFATDPDSMAMRENLMMLYLAVGDVAAAADLVADRPATSPLRVLLAMYRGDVAGAARYARTSLPQPAGRLAQPPRFIGQMTTDALQVAIVADALRTRNYRDAMALLRDVRCTTDAGCAEGPVPDPGAAGSYALLELAAGEREQGTKRLEQVLASTGFPATGPRPLLRMRAARSLAALGRDDEAIALLRDQRPVQHFTPAWLWLQWDPSFDGLRDDPAFREIVDHARQHAAAERRALDELRRAGRVPARPQPAKAAAEPRPDP